MSLKAVVKSVLSGDTLVLRGRPGPNGESAKERILYLADISAPRMGTQSREDEPWAFESREFLRTNLVGKEISFTVTHNLPASSDDANTARDIGTAELAGRDVAGEVIKNGWAKVKDLKRDPTEDDTRKRELEAEAKSAGKGLWNPHGPQAREVHYTMPTDSAGFISEWKGKEIDSIVEQVKDGSTLRVRLLLPDNQGHHVVNLALAGVRSARASGRPGEVAEQWGDEAKAFTETRLLQRSVKTILLSLPSSTGPTPFQQNSSAPAQPTPASIFIGSVIHPAGNVAEHLVAAGLARVVDWHAGMLSATSGAMERLRAAERTAKEKRAALYATAPASSSKPTDGAATGTTSHGARSFEGTVGRVWSADQLSVFDKDGKERRVQLSSIRGPKVSDPKQAYYANEAREFLRKKLIGKHVHVHVDFIRPPEGEFEEREAATVRYGGAKTNIAEQLVEKGLAGVVRHRRDDENRSPDYDKLMVAEQAAINETRGIHSGKEQPAPKPPLNVSETFTRANQFLNGYKRTGRIPAVVDYVAAGSRFKILLPKDNQVITLVLAGIRAPRTARNPSEKSEPFGAEAASFATQRYMQRDVEVEVETVDKSGGFIGTLYLNKTENAAISLAREGLASVHAYSAEGLSWFRALTEAENEAKKAQRGIWKDYNEEAEKAAESETQVDTGALESNYIDVIVSDVRPGNELVFSVQVLNTEGIASLEKLMHEFSIHHRSASSPAGFNPRPGELVSARFSDGAWYRAKIKRASAIKKEAEVVFIDYGNHSTVGFKDLRPLDPKFRSLKGQAQDARLSFVKLAGPESEYHTEAVERFRSLCEGRKLVANIDHKDGQLLHLRLIDPANPAVANDKLASINAELVQEGLATVDRKGCRYLSSYPNIQKYLKQAITEAKRERAGMFEFGDVEEDD